MKAARVVLLLALAVACGKKDAASTSTAGASGDSAAPPPAEGAGQAEAAKLGHELFDLVDRTMGYYSAHLGEFPPNINAVGVDSLTSATVRRLSVQGKVPTVTVAFRHPEGHDLRSCAGTNRVLEDSMLNDGAFTVVCTLADGSTRPFTVGGSGN